MVNVKEHANVWDEILLILKDHISSYAYKNWFKESTVLLSVKGHQVEIGVPNGTYKNVIKNKFGHKIQKCCEMYLGHHVTVSYTVYGKLAQYMETKSYSVERVASRKSI